MGNYASWMTTTALSMNAAEFGNEIMDSYFNRNKTLAAIAKYEGVEDRSTGDEFTWPVSKEGGTAQWFSRATKISDNMPDPILTTEWQMKFFQVPVKVYYTDEVKNRQSKTKVFDFVKAHQSVAKDTAEETIDSGLWAATSVSDAPNSIPELVDASTTVGGAAPAAWTDVDGNNGWASDNTYSSYSFASAGIDNMHSTLITLYNRNSNVDVIFMGTTVYGYFMKAAEDKHILTNTGTTMGFGIGKIPFSGYPVEVGPNVTTDAIYFLDLSTLRVRRNKGATTMTPWQDMENEFARKSHYIHCLCFYIKNRRKNAKHTSITA
jgi:hypothetical protein